MPDGWITYSKVITALVTTSYLKLLGMPTKVDNFAVQISKPGGQSDLLAHAQKCA